MDGFKGHEAVIVIAATNRPDVLDPALLRPGRFDRHLSLDLPDRIDRLATLKVHTRKVPMEEGVDLEQLAAGTSGFSGADDDIRQATALARNMVSRWRMDDDVGPMDLREREEHPFLGREMAQPRRYSEHSARVVDKAVGRLFADAEGRARGLIRDQRGRLDRLIAEFEKRETLHRHEIEAILGDRDENAGEPIDESTPKPARAISGPRSEL